MLAYNLVSCPTYNIGKDSMQFNQNVLLYTCHVPGTVLSVGGRNTHDEVFLKAVWGLLLLK